MTDTPNLGLTLIAEAQTQKHVTANEAFARIDAAAQLSVESRAAAAPPANPAEGARWLIPSGASGAFAGREGRIAVFDNGGWTFLDPKPGWRAWIVDEADFIVYDGAVWASLSGPDLSSITELGVNAAADATNRLTVKSDAALFSHDDVTPGSGDMRVTLNKADAADTASLVFQSNWSGRAEMGLAGDDAFAVKVSADGSTWTPALTIDPATGAVSFPNTDLTSVPDGGAEGQVLAKASAADGDAQWVDASVPEFGDGDPVNTDYITARGLDLISNSTGLLGNNYNYPDDFIYDPVNTPNLPAAFSYAGRHGGARVMEELISVDPNKVYRLGCYLQQEALPGDWSAHSQGDRHRQYMGLLAYDIDGNEITSPHHMRYRHGGVDSLTTLAAPLTPGDTQITVADATGWNESASSIFQRGVIIFGYENSFGAKYDYYSRLVQIGLFDLGGVNKTTGVVTLNAAFPSALGNPNDANGTWPVGTRLANCSNGNSYKYAFFSAFTPAASGVWYEVTNYMGGLDLSGTNLSSNFPPGTALVKPFWLPNFSNRAGGYGSYPDTGAAHRVWFTGVSVTPDPYATLTPNANGSQAIKVLTADPSTGALSMQTATQTVAEA